MLKCKYRLLRSSVTLVSESFSCGEDRWVSVHPLTAGFSLLQWLEDCNVAEYLMISFDNMQGGFAEQWQNKCRAKLVCALAVAWFFKGSVQQYSLGLLYMRLVRFQDSEQEVVLHQAQPRLSWSWQTGAPQCC